MDIKSYTGGKKLDVSKRWYLYYYTADGKMVKVYEKINVFHTISERFAVMEELKRSICVDFSEELSSENVLISMIEQFLKENEEYWKQKTYQLYRSRMKVLKAFIVREDIRAFSDENAKEFMVSVSSKKVAKRTYNAYKQMCYHLFSYCLPDQPNPFRKIQSFPKSSSSPARYFQDKDVKYLKSVIENADPQLWLFIRFMTNCFIRPGSLRLLKVGDIFWDSQKVVIAAKINKKDRIQYSQIPTNFFTEIQYLKEYPSTDYIFGNTGKPGLIPWGVNSFKIRHQAILKSINFNTDQYKLYSWRHTGAHRTNRQLNGNVSQLQKLFGHASVGTTYGYLRQIGIEETDEIRDKLEGL